MSRITDKIKRIFGFQIQSQIQEMVKPSVVLNTGTQVLKSMKPHLPMIKFRAGSGGVHAVTGPSSVGSTSSPTSIAKKQPIGSTSSSGTLEDWQLPFRYRRRPISEEEVAYINRGGGP